MQNTPLAELVLEAAKNAVENGYDTWPDTISLALDMATCDAELENHEILSIQDEIVKQGLWKDCKLIIPGGNDGN